MEGELTSDPNSISACISHFYKQLYTENEGQRPVLDEVEFSMIFEEDVAWLDRQFEEEEVYGIIQCCNSDKPPGPDGFSIFSSSFIGRARTSLPFFCWLSLRLVGTF